MGLGIENLQDLEFLWPDRKFTSTQGEDETVLRFFDYKKQGYCIDFGAADGISHNNCIKLFNEYEWRGLSVEANPRHHTQLKRIFKDTEVKVVPFGIWKENIEYEFVNCMDNTHAGYSKIKEVKTSTNPGGPKEFLTVECKKLSTILDFYNVPSEIDFVSLDIEGAEEEVIYNWDFKNYKVKMWCIEKSERLTNYLEYFGYQRFSIPQGRNVAPYNHFYILK